jgi:hypothetical protein
MTNPIKPRNEETFEHFILDFDPAELLSASQRKTIAQLYWALRLNGFRPRTRRHYNHPPKEPTNSI